VTTPDPLGRSLLLDDGDLVVERPGATATLAQVRGVEALAQALTLALETQLGSDPINVAFGFDLRAIGENPFGVRERREHLRLQLVRTVASDRRVREIRDLYFDDDQRFAELHPGVDLDRQRSRVRATRRANATIELDTIAGDPLALRAGVPNA
jgi:hypothetical protein